MSEENETPETEGNTSAIDETPEGTDDAPVTFADPAPQGDSAPAPLPSDPPVPTEAPAISDPSGRIEDTVFLPRLIAREYGMSDGAARETVIEGNVTINGEPWKGDKMNLPGSEILGKEIVVQGGVRSVRFVYNG